MRYHYKNSIKLTGRSTQKLFYAMSDKIFRRIIFVTIAVVVLYAATSNGSLGILCTNWNTNITAVCSAITAAHNFMVGRMN